MAMAEPTKVCVEVKDLWPGMMVGLPDPEGILCDTLVQVLRVDITESRDTSTSKGFSQVTVQKSYAITYGNERGITGTHTFTGRDGSLQLRRYFGPAITAV